MRKFSYILILLLTVVFASCSKKKTTADAKDYIRPASMAFTAQDTANINNIVNTFIGYINQGDISSASAMLYFVRNDSVLPLDLKKRQNFELLLTKFPFQGAQLKSFHLGGARDNAIAIALKITKDADVETGKNTINLVVNPVVKNGTWYLTLRDNDAEGIEKDPNAE